MAILLSLPAWVVVCWFMLKPAHVNVENKKTRRNTKIFMFMCSIAVIAIMGLRYEYTGSLDTHNYFLVFESAKSSTDFMEYMKETAFSEGVSVLGEPAFFAYVWLASRVLPGPRWFLLLSSAIVVTLTARFIKNNSDNYGISWMVFICLGPLTFAMNAMRQVFAMSICLFAYDFAKEKKFIPFVLVVFLAFMFHKSAMIFILMYFIRNMRFNYKWVTFLAAASVAVLVFANNIAVFYDSVVGEDYADAESFESGGASTIIIYVAVILLAFVFSKRLKEQKVFVQLALVVFGFVLYLCRFISSPIYERISYYFFYFVMILTPSVVSDMNERDRSLVTTIFALAAFVLFAYRINSSAFSDFRLSW